MLNTQTVIQTTEYEAASTQGQNNLLAKDMGHRSPLHLFGGESENKH